MKSLWFPDGFPSWFPFGLLIGFLWWPCVFSPWLLLLLLLVLAPPSQGYDCTDTGSYSIPGTTPIGKHVKRELNPLSETPEPSCGMGCQSPNQGLELTGTWLYSIPRPTEPPTFVLDGQRLEQLAVHCPDDADNQRFTQLTWLQIKKECGLLMASFKRAKSGSGWLWMALAGSGWLWLAMADSG